MFLAPSVWILEPLKTHTFAPICDFRGPKLTHTPPFHCAITQFAVKKLVWCVGVYSPYVVYPNDVMCDSELFGHVSKIHESNPTIHVYELANLFNCRHSKNRLFVFFCQYFESSKLIQFRTHRQTVSISPLICVKIDFLPENSVSNLYTRGIPHAVAKTQIYSLQHVLPAVTVPKHQGINST